MKKELFKRLAGLGILIVVAVLTAFLHGQGQAQRPKTYSISFHRGTELDEKAKTTLDQALNDALIRYRAHVVVTGHTGTRGDSAANRKLAEKRARTVAGYLMEAGIEKDRIDSLGLGGSQPLTQLPDESERAYQRRLARADITVAP